MNLKFYITAGLFVLSEIMPLLPIKSNGVLHMAINGLHELHLMSDSQFNRFETTSQQDINHDGHIGPEHESSVVTARIEIIIHKTGQNYKTILREL